MRSSPSSPCTGVVLAGGASARFGGQPKGLLEVGGRRLVERVADALRPVTDALIVVANEGDEELARLTRARVHRDIRPERGSLVGLHSALAWSGGATLVVAWDMPFVPSGLLGELRAEGERLGTAVVPEGPNGLEPICAFYPSGVVQIAEERIARGELRMSAFVDALPALRVLPRDVVARFGDPGRIFTNVNTPRDLADAVAWAGEGEGHAAAGYLQPQRPPSEHR